MALRQWGGPQGLQHTRAPDETEQPDHVPEQMTRAPEALKQGFMSDIKTKEVSPVPAGANGKIFPIRRAGDLAAMVREAVQTAFETMFPNLFQSGENQMDRSAGSQTQTQEQDPVDETAPVTAEMVRGIVADAVKEAVKPFAEKLEAMKDIPDQVAQLTEKQGAFERALEEQNTSIASQKQEMERAFDSFRPGSQVEGEKGGGQQREAEFARSEEDPNVFNDFFAKPMEVPVQ